MALGPGALQLLLQPTHVNNPASGQGIHRAAELVERKRNSAWEQQQAGREFEHEKQKHDFEVGKFVHGVQDKKRLEEMSVYDELLEAEASQDPQKMLAALNKARARGVTAPGYEEKINNLYKSDGGKGQATEPEKSPEAPAATPPPKGGIKGPIVGENIGDGWEVVETPPEAMAEGGPPPRPAQWLTNEMEARGEISVQPQPGWERSPFTGEMLPPLPQESITTQAGPPPAGIAGPQGLRGGLPQGPASQQPPAPPGATVVYGSDGRPLGTVDPETATARSRERVRAALSPLMENARTPEEQRAAAIAMDSGQRLVGTMTVDKIVENAQQRYDAELGRDTAKTVARGGKEAGGAPAAGSGAGSYTEDTGLENQDFRINDSARQIAEGLKRAYNTKALNEAVSANAAMVANAGANTGVQNLAAVKHMLQITENGRLSNQDLEMALASGGKLNQLHAQLMAWTAEGRLPPGYLKSVQAYGKVLQAIELEKRAEIYEEGLASIRANRLFASLSPEDQEWWAQWVAGYASNTMRRVKQKPLRKKGKKGEQTEAPAGDADAEADALMGGD